ncbi:MAG: type II secretion system protein, partial [Candidatus Micrarchaeaceae archaeon]
MSMKLGIRFWAVGRAQYARSGFTIVETMIVLAITGALFIAIASTLAGRQNSAEFNHAIQTVQAQIQQTVNQVSAGFYPSNSNFTCSASGSAVIFNSGAVGQGSNQD